ncbi:hypothetical protein L3Q67_01580 [Saccharothrix sp. AJ9571]|nr:hypothetical protein L3Q67_01580 [Saccharothrix sp. AJ9571]
MTTILFVHGTGVRGASYEKSFKHVVAGIARIRPSWRVARCYWGDELGAKLLAGGASIPTGASRGGPDDDPEVALWWALERDPLFELRTLAAAGAGEVPDLPPSAEPPGEWLAEVARTLPTGPLAELLAEAGLADAFPGVVAEVLADETCADLLLREHEFGDALPELLSRAFVAYALADEMVDGDTRDDLVRATVDALGASGRSVLGTAGKTTANLLMRIGGSWYVDRRRTAWSEAAAPLAGDVLIYLTRGERLRNFIAKRVAELDGPVILLAHSLGGIAALELLATRSLPQVQQLVTVGSQVALLHELDALPTLPFGDTLPASVPQWVNVYDRRDLLAYQCAELFCGRVEDRAVDNRTPFPTAHSAYFFSKNRRFYGLLDEVLR